MRHFESHTSRNRLWNTADTCQRIGREIVRVIDLTALVECLTHNDLPGDVEAELLGLINATLTELK